jgi:hypothetical protein
VINNHYIIRIKLYKLILGIVTQSSALVFSNLVSNIMLHSTAVKYGFAPLFSGADFHARQYKAPTTGLAQFRTMPLRLAMCQTPRRPRRC